MVGKPEIARASVCARVAGPGYVRVEALVWTTSSLCVCVRVLWHSCFEPNQPLPLAAPRVPDAQRRELARIRPALLNQ